MGLCPTVYHDLQYTLYVPNCTVWIERRRIRNDDDEDLKIREKSGNFLVRSFVRSFDRCDGSYCSK
jgi:hypothetical protein